MKPFDDEQLYDEIHQGFGSVVIRNYKGVLQRYNYGRYVNRFRALAKMHRLSPSQRPKLNEHGFSSLMKRLTDAMVSGDEENLLKDQRNVRIASRLLLSGLFDEDWA